MSFDTTCLQRLTANDDSVARWLVCALRNAPEQDAIVFPGVKWNYQTLVERSVARAHNFCSLGLKPGDHAGIFLNSSLELIELYLGAALAGLVTVFLNARFRAHELNYAVSNSDIKILFTSKGAAPRSSTTTVAEAFPDIAGQHHTHPLSLMRAPNLKHIVVVDAEVSYDAFLGYRAFTSVKSDETHVEEIIERALSPSLQNILAMFYTSGTTSTPKGCPLPTSCIVSKAPLLARGLALSAGARFWNPLPGFHIGFVMPFMAAISSQATIVTSEHFDPAETLALLQNNKVTHTHPGFVNIWDSIVTHESLSKFDLSLVQAVMCSGPLELLERAERILPNAKIINSYGCTESAGSIAIADIDAPFMIRACTVGRPFQGAEVRIVDPETLTEKAAGTIGEIQLRGSLLFSEYYKAPEKNAEAILPDGWFRTGDLGSLDQEGRLIITGRIKDMIKVGGENVASAEVEGYLSTHPAVALAQVIGVPDARLQEVPAAFIQLRPNVDISKTELIGFCLNKIASFKIPRYVVFVDEWPMSATKIQKHRLAEINLGQRLYDLPK